MRIRPALIAATGIAALISAGCYNDPHTSEKRPGEGPAHIMSKPAVGPGTTAGGSTAGPQPRREEPQAGHVQPAPGGAVAAEPGLDHAGRAQPAQQHGAGTPQGPASRTGNEKGGEGRGPADRH
jgi:hypothetical protein